MMVPVRGLQPCASRSMSDIYGNLCTFFPEQYEVLGLSENCTRGPLTLRLYATRSPGDETLGSSKPTQLIGRQWSSFKPEFWNFGGLRRKGVVPTTGHEKQLHHCSNCLLAGLLPAWPLSTVHSPRCSQDLPRKSESDSVKGASYLLETL